ncbi:ABC transporter permease subunit [Domibacillus sp. DTU_2020_1001157_1_SI_ALB_TIR_016]|uniref:ABC transporter permease n=1 Tax=Domibacillus sp. DTU_2020_1001157_1_SI_ALB_TIR_016 TaxID=3077789 RepID=UPI0028EDF1A8|nr:ABC transporter permease subunit [Domibacillus sp. DTU_2020_1001157_1_SI_ALB_TIR_016]WNS78239.1 ABC transporter permease subunit [Domibacillus sp. DTU_2020_1001157_1_SI_ALB_TIR_016]
MNAFYVIWHKEWIQLIREAKIIWMPLAFMGLGTAQPVLLFFLPSILEAVGGGQGITIDPAMTHQSGDEVLAGTLASQFDQMGLIIIVVSTMGIIQADKVSGMLKFILTKPVTVGAYIGGKIAAGCSTAALSVAAGFAVSFIYTDYLFTDISFRTALPALLLYLLWVFFIVSFTAMVSTLFNGQAVIALISIACLLAFRILAGLHPMLGWLNPASASLQAIELLSSHLNKAEMFKGIAATVVWIIITVAFSYKWIVKKRF